MLAPSKPLLVLTPDRVARELRAVEEAAYWAAEGRRSWYHSIGVAARLWWAGVWFLGWSVSTDSNTVGQIGFWTGLLLGNLAPYAFLMSRNGRHVSRWSSTCRPRP